MVRNHRHRGLRGIGRQIAQLAREDIYYQDTGTGDATRRPIANTGFPNTLLELRRYATINRCTALAAARRAPTGCIIVCGGCFAAGQREIVQRRRTEHSRAGAFGRQYRR
jgi:hypothetical protein